MKNDKVTFQKTEDIANLLPKINDVLYKRLDQDGELTSLVFLLIGILNRTYELAESTIWSIDNNRPITTSSNVRCLYETLAFITYIEAKISTMSDNEELMNIINNALLGDKKSGGSYSQVNILTCLDKASKKFPDLRNSYDDICEIVHPNAMSHLSPFHATSKKNKEISLTLPCYKFKNDDKIKSTNHAGECCLHIITTCENLLK